LGDLEQEQRIAPSLKLPFGCFQLFEKLKSMYPKATSKVEALSGDVTALNLGLSASDRARVTAQASIIFHVAASVRFDDPLRSAVLLNTRGAREVVQLAKDLQNIAVNTSSPFSQSHRQLSVLKVTIPTSIIRPGSTFHHGATVISHGSMISCKDYRRMLSWKSMI